MRPFERIQELEASLASKQTEAQLLRTALNHVGRGLQMVDERGYVVVANDLAGELTGVPASFLTTRPHYTEVVSMQWQSSEFAAASEELHQRFLEPIEKNSLESYRRMRPNGRMVEVESIPLVGGGVVRIHTDVTERHEHEQRIAYLARHDYLTGLFNRASFQEALEQALHSGVSIALLLIDIDRFKEINDVFGHPSGDALLVDLAARLRETVRPNDTVARFGGDEFALMLHPVKQPGEVEALAARLIAAMEKPFIVMGKQCVTGISVGIAMSLPDTNDNSPKMSHSELMHQADLALYAAKSAGRGAWRTFDPALQAQHLAEQIIVHELQVALAAGQFEVFYQPVIDATSGRVSAFEALVRWHHPVRGLLAAGDFVPQAEASGLIVPLGGWVLRQACLDAALWPSEVRVLVNFSPRQLGSSGLFEAIESALSSAGLDASRLEIEITETSLLQMSHAINMLMIKSRALGIRIALDDFGTGYSSLSHLQEFAFDTVKIDRSFVAEATVRQGSWAIIRAVTGLAADLGLTTIAEGVETMEQSRLLQAIGCHELQGYLFSPPRPVSELAVLYSQLNGSSNSQSSRPFAHTGSHPNRPRLGQETTVAVP